MDFIPDVRSEWGPVILLSLSVVGIEPKAHINLNRARREAANGCSEAHSERAFCAKLQKG